MPSNLIRSEPFKRLSPNAVWVLIQFLDRKKIFTREYYDYEIPKDKREKLSLTYSEVKGKMGNNRFSKSIKELQKNGFLELLEHGGLYRRKNIYVLSNDWKFNDLKEIKILQEKKERQDYARIFKSWGGLTDENKTQQSF